MSNFSPRVVSGSSASSSAGQQLPGSPASFPLRRQAEATAIDAMPVSYVPSGQAYRANVFRLGDLESFTEVLPFPRFASVLPEGKVARISTALDEETLRSELAQLFFPEDLVVTIPRPEDRGYLPPQGYVTIYLDYLKAGLRLFLSQVLPQLLRNYRIPLAQLLPNSVRSVIGFELSCFEKNIIPSMSLFTHFFSLKCGANLANGWFYLSPKELFKVDTPSKNDKWKKFFFFSKTDSLPHYNWNHGPLEPVEVFPSPHLKDVDELNKLKVISHRFSKYALALAGLSPFVDDPGRRLGRLGKKRRVPIFKRTSSGAEKEAKGSTPSRSAQTGVIGSVSATVTVASSGQDMELMADERLSMPPPAKRFCPGVTNISSLAQAMAELTETAQRLVPSLSENARRAEVAEAQLAEERQLRKKAEDELLAERVEMRQFRSDVRRNQGRLLRNFLNKLFTTNAFSQFFQHCAEPLVKSGKGEILQVVNADFPELPPLNSKYNLHVPTNAELNDDYMWRVVTAPPFPLLDLLVKQKDLLTVEFLKNIPKIKIRTSNQFGSG